MQLTLNLKIQVGELCRLKTGGGGTQFPPRSPLLWPLVPGLEQSATGGHISAITAARDTFCNLQASSWSLVCSPCHIRTSNYRNSNWLLLLVNLAVNPNLGHFKNSWLIDWIQLQHRNHNKYGLGLFWILQSYPLSVDGILMYLIVSISLYRKDVSNFQFNSPFWIFFNILDVNNRGALLTGLLLPVWKQELILAYMFWIMDQWIVDYEIPICLRRVAV